MAREDPDATIAKAHAVFIRLALPPYSVHFKSPTYLHPTTLDLLDKKVSKETLKATSSTSDTSAGSAIREAIGTDNRFWEEWVEVLRAAVPSLERRSFDILDDGSSVDYESARGALIASNYPGLWKDLERLNDIVSIGRNVLTVGKPAQNLAAEYGVESEMFRLVHVCVRVTARGYDSEAGTQEEEKWQWVVNAYKKVLITSLQFLNNLVAQNEERKLRLWVSLFDTPAPTEQQDEERKQVAQRPPPPPPEPAISPEPPWNTNDILLAYGTTGPSQRLSPLEMQAAQPMYANEGFKEIPWPAANEAKMKVYKPNAWVYFVSQYKKKCIEDFQKVHNRSPMLGEIHKNLPRYWHELEEEESVQQRKPDKHGFRYTWIVWDLRYKNAMKKYKEDLEKWDKRDDSPPAPRVAIEPPKPPPVSKPSPPPLSFKELEDELTVRMKETGPTTAPAGYNFAARQDLEFNPLKPRGEDEEKDLKMLFTADAGKKILEVGKVELMRRLEGEGGSDGRRHSTSGQGLSPPAGSEVADGSMAEMMYDEIQKGRAEEARRTGRRRTSEPSLFHPHLNDSKRTEDSLEEEEVDDSDESGSDSGSDESYPGSSEDGRGLLTDVPLILGPSEIEVLPMLIMSGIVETVPGPNKPWLTEWEFHGAPPFVPWEEKHEGQLKMRQWHTLRTNLLLSNTSGRNLLRELLIFVAAWDLREEELYFKFMLKITESILKNGLMPYAYHAFRDRSKSKDIISPAQAVLIKLLTSIFRTRTSTFLHALRDGSINHPERLCAHGEYGPMPFTLYLARMKYAPTRADLQLMTFLFSEFRQHIIPQTCALIFLQGQVRRGRAGNEDFPLNLWDMERMYEGVYQVLEFFAGIVEEIPANSAPAPPAEGLYGGPAHPLSGYWLRKQFEGLRAEAYRGEERWPTAEAKQMEKECRMGEWFSWKKVLAEWEMVSELVTLLRELEDGIPKVNAQQGVPQQKAIGPPPGQLASNQQRSLSADAAVTVGQGGNVTDGPPPFAVERPFDIDPPNSDSTLPPLPQQYQQQNNEVFEPEHPLAYPEDQTGQLPYNPPLSSHDQDEPADFEWRNLKKLTVLVLSSLVWKNKQVQDQLREYGGLEVLLRCCREDENNPYIREHAIMCLRFAVEGNQANRDAIKEIAETKGLTLVDKKYAGGASSKVEEVPSEVLDEHVYETHMDGGGRVGLRRKDQVSAALFHPGQTDTSISLPSSATASGAAASASGKNKGPNGWIGNYGAATTAPTPDTSNAKHADTYADYLSHVNRLAEDSRKASDREVNRSGKAAQTEMTAEEAAELMQKALRNLPLGDKAPSDLQKAEALANLDRAFEGFEKALGQGSKKEEGGGK